MKSRHVSYKNIVMGTALAGLIAVSLPHRVLGGDKITHEENPPGHITALKAKSNQFWWPDQLDLSSLRDHDKRSNPLGEDFEPHSI